MLHNDEPTVLDTLDRSILIKEVGDAIAHCAPPQVFGIHGDWGLGKTSFLHQLQLYLTGQCPQQSRENVQVSNISPHGVYKKYITAVWFDAWRYQYEHAPIVALLQEMRSQLSWKNRVRSKTRRNTEVLIRGALLSMEEVTKQIGIQYSKFSEAHREWEASNLATSLPSHTLREHLRAAIDNLLPRSQRTGGQDPCLVVFVDDLDRCEPDIAYRLLEGLKIYLTLDNCAFVLGMNQKAIADAIATRLSSSSDDISKVQEAVLEAVNARLSSHSGDAALAPIQIENKINIRASAYMEKLCQNIWHLPTIRNPANVLQILLEKTVKHEVIRDSIFAAIQEHHCLPPNPRRLKGLANVIGRMIFRLPAAWKEWDAKERELEIKKLLIVAYVYHFHTDLYIRWESDPTFYNKIWDRCEGRKTDIPVLSDFGITRARGDRHTSSHAEIYFRKYFPRSFRCKCFLDSAANSQLGHRSGF